MSAVTAQQREFSRKLRAAIDVCVLAHGCSREWAFDVLTDTDPDITSGVAGLLEQFPPALFPLDQLPVSAFPVNPTLN
jgi:hypothetical protein